MQFEFVLLSFFITCSTCQAVPSLMSSPKLESIILSSNDNMWLENGVFNVFSHVPYKFILFGSNLNNAYIRFTDAKLNEGDECDNKNFMENHPIKSSEDDTHFIEAILRTPNVPEGQIYYLCLSSSPETGFIGQSKRTRIMVHSLVLHLPVWLRIVIFSILLLFSGMFSGLNLGLMSLSPHELSMVAAVGKTREKYYAKSIIRLRSLGNVLLCSILIGNTIVNTTMAVLMGDMTSGFVAVMISTTTIVIVGEIIPQSVCSRHGLAIASYTRHLTWFVVFVTSPVSFPLGKFLDFLLGHQTPHIYNRDHLLEIMKHNTRFGFLEQDEANIITGALKYRNKKVADVMTPLSQCFMLEENSVLDFDTLSVIVRYGYSRIPIYSKEPSNVIAIMMIKDLTFVDPDDLIPLSNIINFYNHPIIRVFKDTTLDKVLKQFSLGTCHLAIVMDLETSPNSDPVSRAIGVVTLEDVIEEIIQSEIEDETDLNDSSDRHTLREAHRSRNLEPFLQFLSKPHQNSIITPSTLLKVCQYLVAAILQFRPEVMSGTVLQKLITHPGCVKKKTICNSKEKQYLVRSGQKMSSFILILEGTIDVTVGNEKLLVRQGALSHFGIPALKITERPDLYSFVPDYTIEFVETTVYVEITCVLYNMGVRATKIERSLSNETSSIDPWDSVVGSTETQVIETN